jgi:hypothetical protein
MELSIRLAKLWFHINLAMVIVGLVLIVNFDLILDNTHFFFRILLSFMATNLIVVGLIGLLMSVVDNYHPKKRLKNGDKDKSEKDGKS